MNGIQEGELPETQKARSRRPSSATDVADPPPDPSPANDNKRLPGYGSLDELPEIRCTDCNAVLHWQPCDDGPIEEAAYWAHCGCGDVYYLDGRKYLPLWPKGSLPQVTGDGGVRYDPTPEEERARWALMHQFHRGKKALLPGLLEEPDYSCVA